MNLRPKVIEAVATVLVVAVVARVVWDLLEPLLPYFVLLAVIGSILLWLFRGPGALR